MPFLVLWLAALPLTAAPVLLYDAANNSVPGAQGWIAVTGSATETLPPNFVQLDSTASLATQAGYTRVAPFALDLTTGFTLRFDVRVSSESHNRPERAGFSVLLLGSTFSGIELGFWTDTIFAQNQGFLTTGESATFDTSAAITRYDLTLRGTTYALSTNGNAILSGALRDYSSHPFPIYSLPNAIFFGDNTTSAGANLEWAYADLTAIPEPATIWYVVLGAFGIGIGAYRRVQR